MDAELKSKRNFEWIKVLAWGFIAIILFVVGNFKIQKNTIEFPNFEELIHISGEVNHSDKIVTSNNTYLKICLKGFDKCFKYSSGLPGWRNAQRILIEGNKVEVWAGGGTPMFIWQFKHNGKVVETYKLVKWHLKNTTQVQVYKGYGIVLLGVLILLIEIRRVVKLMFG